MDRELDDSTFSLARSRRYRTIPEALFAAPSTRAFVTMWKGDENSQTLSFGEFLSQARAQAALFRAHQVQPGDTIVLVMPQGIALMTAFVGAMLSGAVPAILAYPNFKVEPAKYRFGLSGVTANLKARLVVLDEAFPDELLDCVALGERTGLVRALKSEAAPVTTDPPSTPQAPGELAFIQHSAGTTGLQKGVALSHAAVLRQLDHLAEALHITDDDRIYSWLPLYHDMGLIACFMLPIVYHLPLVMQSPTDWVMQPATMLELISSHRCTLAWIPNFTLQFLARRVRHDRDAYDLSSLRALINCSEPVRAASMDEFLSAYATSKLRANVLQSSYAIAETVFAVTQSGIGSHPGPRMLWADGERLRSGHQAVPATEGTAGAVRFVSSGPCLPESEIRVVSPTGEDLPPGGVGEILIRSDSLFDGYYNRPDLTSKVLQDGWYWSGDLGFILDGEVYIIGRKKDLIIVAGKNIYPQDVEEIVYGHPAIHDGRAVALGFFNPNLGTEEIIVVAEVQKEEDLTDAVFIERAIRNAIVGELDVAVGRIYLKPPKWIVKSTAGKPARSTTREKLLAEHPELSQNVA